MTGRSGTGGEIGGRLASGIGQGRHFTRLPWARAQFVERLGIDPFPGTFNIVVDDPDAMPVWVRLRRTPGIRMENPGDGPHDCDARCYRVLVEGRIEAAIVYPEVDGYPPAQIEIVAEIGLREALGVEDGDPVRLAILRAEG
ncbi:MAG: CTP-dependent riboflavin kinase [Defluviicoccus sp.]|nr:CTP-dependent riboflavin kinase [Defluviicoccus sp.]